MFMTEPLNPEATAIPDTSDHSSGALSILVTNGVFIPLVTIITALRIYTKFFMARNLFLDDYLMLAAALSFLVFASVNIAAVPIGFGRHGWDLPGAALDAHVHAAERVLEHNFVGLVFLSPALGLAKVSIVATLLRIFTPQATSRPPLLRRALAAAAVAAAVGGAAQLVFTVFQCSRVELSWALVDPAAEGSCGSLEEAVLAGGVVNVVVDFVICCSPVPVFMRLQLPLRQRLCVSALFLSGLIASLFAVLRVVSSRGLENNPDATYVVVPYFNYSTAEAGLCIITGSIPALRPLLANILPSFVDTYNLENLVISAKANIRRAASRPVSRQRLASDAGLDSSQQSSAAASEQNWTDVERAPEVPRDEEESHVLAGWTSIALLRRARSAVVDLVERLRGASHGGERTRGRRDRPLSMIDELGEVSEEGWRRSEISALRRSVVELFRKQSMAQNISSSLTDARRRLASVELPRPGGGGGGVKSLGGIVVMREVEVMESKKEDV